MAERSKGRKYKERTKGKQSGKSKERPVGGERQTPMEFGVRKDQGSPVDLDKCKGIDFVKIDGSVLEGGGQILRNAVAYCCILCRPVHIVKIRAGRSNPGLKPQHLTGIRLIREICRGTLMGDKVGSSEIYFIPDQIHSGDFIADVHTAGSVCLMLQAALPCLLSAPAPSTLTLRGGTNAEMAPPIDYITDVLQPVLAKFGITFKCDIVKRGFYPKGGGEVVIAVEPAPRIEPIALTERGQLTELKIECYATREIPSHVVPCILASCCDVVERELKEECHMTKNGNVIGRHEAIGNGCGLNCVAMTNTGCYYGGNAIGRPGLPSEEVGKVGGDMIARALNTGACVDEHLQDQVKFHQRQNVGSKLLILSCEGIGPVMKRK